MIDLSAIASEARGLMNQHGLGHWVFQWDNAVRRLGSCRYSSRTITLSEKLARRTTPEVLRDTILHEIAHAMVGPGHGHGMQWRMVARKIGCTAERCYGSSDVEAIPGKWQAVCPGCGKTFHKHRKPAPNRLRCCRACGMHRGLLSYRAVR